MKMNYALIIVFVLLFIFFVVRGYSQSNKSSFEVYTDKQGFIKIVNAKNLFEELYNRFAPEIVSSIERYNMEIPLSMVLAMIRQESSSLFKTKSNSQVIGDDGKSIGYTQCTKYAVADFNKRYGTDFTFQDLKDEETNISIGSGYLNLCYESAIRSGSGNPVKLAFKKYNGGNDETENSLNLMASNYANSVYNWYKEFQKIG